MKKILIGVAVVVVLAVGGVVYFASNLDSIIKAAVEKFGSEATKTQVTLSSVDLSLQSGEASLNGFKMTNPAGFKTDQAMSFGTVSVKIDTGSLTGDVIVIKEVVIAAPDITYESGDGGSNFDVIQKNVDAYAKSLGAKSPGAGGGEAKPADDKAGKKIIIENLYVRDGKVALSAGILAGKKITVPLPDIHLKDIGKKDKGATPAEIASQLLDELTGKIAGVGKAGLESAAKAAQEAMEGAKKMMEGAGDGAKKMMEGAGSGVEDATKSIKGLFGK